MAVVLDVHLNDMQVRSLYSHWVRLGALPRQATTVAAVSRHGGPRFLAVPILTLAVFYG